MNLVIIGGHGKVALLTAPKLVAAGHQVSSVIRSQSQSDDVAAAGATPVVADIEALDIAQIAQLIADFDVVVWSAGAGGGSSERTYAVDRDSAIRTMQAAESAGTKLFVMVSWLGSVPDHGVDPANPFFAYADAKLAADDYLRGSALNWIILGPGRLTLAEPTGSITLHPAGAYDATNSNTSRANVAQVIAQVVSHPAPVTAKFIGFTDGDTAISQALAGAQ